MSTAIEAINYYFELASLFELQVDRNSYVYRIHDNDYFESAYKENPSELQKVYWQEILQRAHWAALSSLLRNFKWVQATKRAIDDCNLLSFTSNLRCLIESCGDNLLTLQSVSATLADNNRIICDSINGIISSKGLATSSELENVLIHFAYARKITEEEKKIQGKLPKYQNAKPTVEYLKKLDRVDKGPINNLYSILCQFAHPAAHSIQYLFDLNFSDNIYQFSYSPYPDKQYIDIILDEYRDEIINSIMLGFNPSFLTLKTLNLFPYQETRTPLADTINLDNLNAWKKICDKFGINGESK